MSAQAYAATRMELSGEAGLVRVNTLDHQYPFEVQTDPDGSDFQLYTEAQLVQLMSMLADALSWWKERREVSDAN